MPRAHRPLAGALVAAVAAAAAATATLPPRVATADRTTVSVDTTRSGWDGGEPQLTASAVAASSFAELYRVPVDGVVYAQPVTAHGIAVVATEHDRVDGIDLTTGAMRWSAGVGTYEPDSFQGCDQVTPHLGVTSTPVIDPATDTVYVSARDWSSNAAAVAWRLHALDLFSGQERAGWPVTIAGHAANSPSYTFDANQHQQRPGLLLLGGTVFAGFGSYCDIQPYQGWLAGVSTSTRAQSLWITEPHGQEGAIWASGGGPVSDGPGTILVATANGRGSDPGNDQAPVGAGTAVNGSTDLGDAVVRLRVGSDGISVTPVDYFGPSAADTSDADLGSSQVSVLPDGYYGTRHLAVVGGKTNTIWLLDRDNLGGRSSSGDTGALARDTSAGSLYGHVAAWPGDGGWFYADTDGALRAFQVTGNGTGLVDQASTSSAFGSGSPLVTSDGTSAGSAVVWIYARGAGELRAYQAVPQSGALTEIFHAAVGTANGPTKFVEPASDSGRLLIAADDGFLHVYGAPGLPPVPCNCPNPGSRATQGYWLVGADGGIFVYGNAAGYGSTGARRLNQPVVGMAATADRHGYWLVAADGGIFPFGDAGGLGSTGGIRLNRPIVGMAATPSGSGYWLVAADGGIFPFGDAAGYGSTGGVHLNQPIVGMAATPTGHGYWLVAADGGIFPFGDAGGLGSTGAVRLNRPIVGMAATASGHGYWLVASDGGIFPFGDAPGYGSTGGIHLNQPIVGMAATPTGHGYWLVAADGGIFPFGDAQGLGSAGGVRLTRPVVGMSGS